MTRKGLKAMGLTDEQIDSIIEMHTETVDGLKDQLKTAKEKADKLDGVEKELNDLKAQGDGGYKEKYEKEHKAFTDYKADVDRKESHAAKETAVKAYLESKNITGSGLRIAMMAVSGKIDGLELDGDKIKDTSSLDDLVKDGGDLHDLIPKVSVTGANTATPPANTGGGKMTKEQIWAIKDAGERQKAIAANHEMFGF